MGAKPKRQLELETAEPPDAGPGETRFQRVRRLELKNADGSDHGKLSAEAGGVHVDLESREAFEKEIQRAEFVRHLKIKLRLHKAREENRLQEMGAAVRSERDEIVARKVDKVVRLVRIAGRLAIGSFLIYFGTVGTLRFIGLLFGSVSAGANGVGNLAFGLLTLVAFATMLLWRRLNAARTGARALPAEWQKYPVLQDAGFVRTLRYVAEGLFLASSISLLSLSPYLGYVVQAFLSSLTVFVLSVLYITIAYVVVRTLFSDAYE